MNRTISTESDFLCRLSVYSLLVILLRSGLDEESLSRVKFVLLLTCSPNLGGHVTRDTDT